jgi:hypothetical protein
MVSFILPTFLIIRRATAVAESPEFGEERVSRLFPKGGKSKMPTPSVSHDDISVVNIIYSFQNLTDFWLNLFYLILVWRLLF